MTIYVLRGGELVEKTQARAVDAPKVSRFEAYESPIDGAQISSDRQRERDLARSGSFDVRDLNRDHEWRRGRLVQEAEARDARERSERQLDFWR